MTGARGAPAGGRRGPEAFLYDGELVGVDRGVLQSAKLNADSVLDAFAAAARKVLASRAWIG